MLTIVIGRAKTGKSTFCFRQFAKKICAGGDVPSYFIVPEQFALSAERQILHLPEMEGRTLFGDEVLSFKRLSHRILNQLGGLGLEHIDESGRIMMLTRAAYELKDQLSYYTNLSERPWQIVQILSLISEFEKYGVNHKVLEQLLQNDSMTTTLRAKLNDLALLYALYSEHLHEKSITESDLFQLAVRKASAAHYFRDASVWVDSFTGFTALERDYLSLMLRECASVTVTLCMDERNEPIFDGIRSTYALLVKLAKEQRVPFKVIDITNHSGRFSFYKKEDLRILEGIFTKYKGHALFTKDDLLDPGIEIHESSTIFDEVVFVAQEIQRLHQQKGTPYGQIAVAAGRIDGYSSLIEAIFTQYGIPFFVDNRRNIENNPLIVLILSLFNILTNGYIAEDVSAFLKTRLYYSDQDLIDCLENTLLATGLRGEKKYCNADCSELKVLGNDLMVFRKNIVSCKNIEQCVVALEQFLEQIQAQKKLELLSDRLYVQNQPERKDEYLRIWDILVHVLSQIKTSLGMITFLSWKDKCTFLHQILSAAFKSYKTGFLPQNPEAVQILGIDRSRTANLTALFLMGATEGVLPSSVEDTGMLSDHERDWITSMAVELADDSFTRALKEQFNIYATLFSPSSYLCISYPLVDDTGNAALPSSMVVGRFKRIYPNIYQTVDKTPSFVVQSQDKHEPSLKNETAQSLFLPGNIPQVSVSRLETYRKCPFMYFMEHGIYAKERDLGETDDQDIGDFMHKLIEHGTIVLLKEKDKDAQSILDTLFDDTMNEIHFSAEIRETERGKMLLERLNRFSSSAIEGIRLQLQDGKFVPVGFETPFGEDEKESFPAYVVSMNMEPIDAVQLHGRIDRFDIYKNQNTLYVRVIDYKSSDQKIAFEDVYLGQRLQLITYMKALIEQRKSQNHIKNILEERDDVQFVPAGVLYFTMKDDLSKIDSNGKKEENNYCMDGFLLDEPIVLDAMIGTTDAPIASVTKGRQGELKAKKSFSISEFHSMSEIVNQVIRMTVRQIASGNMSPVPVCNRAGKLPCLGCAYQSICGIISKKK